MKKLLALLCSMIAMLGLGACDYVAMRDLKPGVSTATDVRDKLGPPNMEWKNDDGSVTWEFSRQPEGIHCYMATIGPDNILRALEQVLTEDNFARVQRGMTGPQVRRMLGKPAREEAFPLQKERVWSWLIDNSKATEPVYFTVSFNEDGRVAGTGRNTDYKGR